MLQARPAICTNVLCRHRQHSSFDIYLQMPLIRQHACHLSSLHLPSSSSTSGVLLWEHKQRQSVRASPMLKWLVKPAYTPMMLMRPPCASHHSSLL